MSYAVIQDVPASWEHYQLIAAGILEPVPAGLIVYAAGRTDEGVRVIGVWENEESWLRFEAEWKARADATPYGPQLTKPVLRDLHAERLIVTRP